VETTTLTARQGRARKLLRAVLSGLVRLELPVLAIWIGAAVGVAAVTAHVFDWFVMTDELLYERLAISVVHLHSPLPHIHGQLIPNASQLYPLLLSAVYRHGLVPSSLHDAHRLNAYVMTSAALPAFLLARAVTRRRLAAYLVALLTACVPWIVLSSFLLTEVVAYPAFLWAMLALYQATASPRLRNDVLALAGIVLATLARTQFSILIVVLAAAIFGHELSLADGRGRARFASALRRTVSGHRLVAAVCVLLAVAATVLAGAGRFSSTFGTYSQAIEGNPFPAHFVPFLAEHVATIAFALGVLPFVIGVAWLVAGLARSSTPEQHAFAVLATLTIGALAIEVTSFDLRFGSGLVRDRYLFYVVPLILVGFAGALCDRRWPRWSLVVPCAILAYGFSQTALPQFQKLNVDTPTAVLDDVLFDVVHGRHAARIVLIVGMVLLTAIFVQASLLLRRAHLAVLLGFLVALLLPAETGYAFSRLFAVNGTSGRPISLDQGVVFDWVDRTIGTNADVAMVPSPSILADYWASVGFWWDLEFWNESVDRAAYLPGQFLWTPSTFPKALLRFDPRTGRANVTVAPYALEADTETRFRLDGHVTSDTRATMLIDTTKPWRADWLTFGLYDDGWTKPGVPGTIRVFSTPGQTHAEIRYLTLGVRAPFGVTARPFTARSNRTLVNAAANGVDRVIEVLKVCVPPRGFSDAQVSTAVASPIGYGQPTTATSFFRQRRAGVLLTEIALADEIGEPCSH